jgi:hypothetical protein
MFATFLLPSGRMVTFCGGVIIPAFYLNTVIAADVWIHTLNKQISKWSLWPEMLLYTTHIQTIDLVKFSWALHKYASGPYVLNWCYARWYECFNPFPSWSILPPSPCKCQD